MRSLLLAVLPFGLWLCVAIHICFLFLCFRKYRKTNAVLFLLSGLVTLGLFYDALILSLGTVLPLGTVLKALSQLRFVSHGGLIPLIFPICAYALKANKKVCCIVWIFTGALILLGVVEGFCTVLESKEIASVVRYTASDATPGWAASVSSLLSYGTVVPLMIAGIVVWRKQKTAALFLSGFLMFAFSALGPATGNFDLIFFISMAGEVLMVLYFYLYAKSRLRKAVSSIAPC